MEQRGRSNDELIRVRYLILLGETMSKPDAGWPEQALCLRGGIDGDRLEFVLRRGENQVGSLPENDVVLTAAGVSRFHAVVRWDEDGLSVEDLGSKNGTLLNGVRVKRGAMRIGDAVCFGPVALVLSAIDVDDAVPAINIGQANSQGGQIPRRQARRTPTAHTDLAPGNWLGALARIGELMADGTPALVPVALEVVRTSTGARAVALLAFKPGQDLEVEHVSGDADFGTSFEESAAALRALLTEAGQSGEPHSAQLGLDPPNTAAFIFGEPGGARALVVQGEFPSMGACSPFLSAALRLLRRRRVAEPPAAGQLRRPLPELVFPADHVVGRTPAMLGLYHQLHHLLAGDLPVLITGETGVGKEHVARILHLSSPRRSGPFVAVNCAAIPTELLEVELFGIEKGVATGVEAREGKMPAARGGVVFLDEVGDMSPALQAKVLRALQEREVHPVGARRPVSLDVRILSATNTDLTERIVQGRFRQDLYFRLAGYTLRVPALRERRGDIPGLVEQFMTRHALSTGRQVRGMSLKALQVMSDAPWPGNVRQLENEVRRAIYLSHEGELVTSALLSEALLASAGDRSPEPVADSSDLRLETHVKALEQRLIGLALERVRGNVAAAARLVGLSRYGLTKKLRKLGLGEKGELAVTDT